jgi:hypothetical protein
MKAVLRSASNASFETLAKRACFRGRKGMRAARLLMKLLGTGGAKGQSGFPGRSGHVTVTWSGQ